MFNFNYDFMREINATLKALEKNNFETIDTEKNRLCVNCREKVLEDTGLKICHRCGSLLCGKCKKIHTCYI